MKKVFISLLAVSLQVAQMPLARATAVEPWMISNTARTEKSGQVLDQVVGRKLTVSQFMKGLEGKINPEYHSYMVRKLEKAPQAATFEIEKTSETSLLIRFEAKTFAFEAVDAVAGEFKFNGRTVKVNYDKSIEAAFKSMYNAAKFGQKTASIEALLFSLMVPEAQAFFGLGMGEMLLIGGAVAAVAGLAYWNYSNCSKYEDMANMCGLNGQYGGQNPTGFVNAVSDLNNSWSPKFFCSSSNRSAATQCMRQTRSMLNQNYYANNPGTYGPGGFPVIRQQLSPYRADAVRKSSQVRQPTLQLKAPAYVAPAVELSGTGQQ